MTEPNTGRAAPLAILDLGGGVNGVFVRSRGWIVAVARRAGGDIVLARSRVPALDAGAGSWPLVRGLVTQARRWHPPVSAMDWLGKVLEAEQTGADVPAALPPEKPGSVASLVGRALWAGVMLTVAQLVACGLLDLAGVNASPFSPALHAATAGALFGISLGYLAIIGRVADVRRVFAYNAAAFQVLAAHEDGEPPSVDAARTRSPLHPWASANFLALAALLLAVAFPLAALPLRGLAAPPLAQRAAVVAAMLTTFPAVHAITYELQRIAAQLHAAGHLRSLWRALAVVQRLVTVPPEDAQLEVAVAAMREVERLEAGADG